MAEDAVKQAEDDGEEPSIEEILTSIRAIISEDDEEEGAVAEANGADTAPETAEDVIMGDEDENSDDDILELTEAVEDEKEELDMTGQDDIDTMFDAEEAPDAQDAATPEDDMSIELKEKEDDAAPEPAPAAEKPASTAKADDEKLISEPIAGAALDTFKGLAKKISVDRRASESAVSIEDIVRELLQPMLSEWLDQHLPGIIEKLVQKELDKLVQKALDE